jgi:hypothetical protein
MSGKRSVRGITALARTVARSGKPRFRQRRNSDDGFSRDGIDGVARSSFKLHAKRAAQENLLKINTMTNLTASISGT